MPANIRYVAQASNRLRSTSTAGLQYVLTVQLSASDLSFETKRKTRISYGAQHEIIKLSEIDIQSLTMNYIEDSGETDGYLQQVREWYKSVSDGTPFEIDIDGVSGYKTCILLSEKYSESRNGTIDEWSVGFKVKWL